MNCQRCDEAIGECYLMLIQAKGAAPVFWHVECFVEEHTETPANLAQLVMECWGTERPRHPFPGSGMPGRRAVVVVQGQEKEDSS